MKPRKLLAILAIAPTFYFAQNQENVEKKETTLDKTINLLEKKLMPSSEEHGKFTPSINYGVAFDLETIYQQVDNTSKAKGSSNYNFEPAAFKYGFLHLDLHITPKIYASASWNLHANKITDVFVKYKADPLFNIQLGRFKGAGNRAANETSSYDLDLIDFTYTSVNQNTDQGAPDLRHYGIDFSGRWNWVQYSFFLHNSDFNRTRTWSGTNDGPTKGNHGLEFKSWDASLRFFPTKNLEFGGHMGSVNMPGMGYKNTYAYSAFAYYTEPNKYTVKFDFGTHKQIKFSDNVDNMDYTEHPFNEVKKLGYSFLVAANVNPNIQPAVSFEHYDQGDQKYSGFKYDHLNLYTFGVNYFLFPSNHRIGKITAFYQYRDERGGVKKANNWFGLNYQFVLYSNTKDTY